jgi:hypothetical protein
MLLSPRDRLKLIAWAIGKMTGVKMLTKIQTWLSGKKTYLTAAVGVLGALAAFGDHQIDLTALIAAVWAAAQTCFIRAGVQKAINQQAQ